MTRPPPTPASAEQVVAQALAGWPIARTVQAAVTLPAPEDERPCQLEGRLGHEVSVRLLQLRQDEGLAMLRIAPAWRRLDLPLAQLTRLSFDSDEPPQHTDPRTLALSLTAGRITRLETVAAAEHALGLFLVCRTPDGLAWRHLYYPLSSYRSRVWGPPARGAEAACRTPDELRLALRVARAQTAPDRTAPRVDVGRYPLHGPTLQRLPYSRARQLEALPLGVLDGDLIVVMDDPQDADALAELGFLFGQRVVPVRPARHSTLHLVNTLYERHGLAPANWRE